MAISLGTCKRRQVFVGRKKGGTGSGRNQNRGRDKETTTVSHRACLKNKTNKHLILIFLHIKGTNIPLLLSVASKSDTHTYQRKYILRDVFIYISVLIHLCNACVNRPTANYLYCQRTSQTCRQAGTHDTIITGRICAYIGYMLVYLSFFCYDMLTKINTKKILHDPMP